MTADWLAEVLDARRHGGEPAVVTPEVRISRAEFRTEVAGCQALLVAAGVTPGTTVAVQVAPSVSYFALVLAALSLDTQVLLLHHRITAAERAACLRSFRPAASVSAADDGTITRFVPRRELRIEAGVGADRDGPGSAIVQFSSGSTGEPKVIRRTARSIRAELLAIGALADWVSGGDVLLTLNSAVHSFGLMGALLHSLRVGGAVAFARSALPAELGRALAELKPTAITGVPAHFDLLATLESGTLGSVRNCVSGGQLTEKSTYCAFERRHGLRIGQVYGLTEVGLVAADVTGELAPAMGRIVAGQQVAISADEVRVKIPESPYVGASPQATMPEGWLRTGDRGELRDGILSVFGRLDALVAIGGLKVDLTEVEGILLSAAGVRAAVVMAANGVIEAFVEPAAAAEAARRQCEAELAQHKRPRTITAVSALPRTLTGKLVRDPVVLARLRGTAL